MVLVSQIEVYLFVSLYRVRSVRTASKNPNTFSLTWSSVSSGHFVADVYIITFWFKDVGFAYSMANWKVDEHC